MRSENRPQDIVVLYRKNTRLSFGRARTGRTHLSGCCVSEGSSLCTGVAGGANLELSPTLGRGAYLLLCLLAGVSFARFESSVFFQECQQNVSSGTIPLLCNN